MFFTTATPSFGNFIITRERDVGVAALILSEAFDIMAQRDLKGVHHQIREGALNALHRQRLPIALLAIDDVGPHDFVGSQVSPRAVENLRFDETPERIGLVDQACDTLLLDVVLAAHHRTGRIP